MNQKQLHGRAIAFGRVKWLKYGEKKDQEGYVFTDNNGFGWKVEKNFLGSNGIVMDALLDCVRQLEEKKAEGADVKKDYIPHAGYEHTGIVLTSRTDPRIACSVVLADDNHNEDVDLHLSWFFDVANDQGNMTMADPERSVEKVEMKKEVEESVDGFGIPKSMLEEAKMKAVSFESVIGIAEDEDEAEEAEEYTVSKTYSVVTPESAKDGDYAETGFEWEDKKMTLSDVLSEINELGFYENLQGRGGSESLYGVDSDTDYKTGEETTYALHIDGSKEAMLKLAEKLKGKDESEVVKEDDDKFKTIYLKKGIKFSDKEQNDLEKKLGREIGLGVWGNGKDQAVYLNIYTTDEKIIEKAISLIGKDKVSEVAESVNEKKEDEDFKVDWLKNPISEKTFDEIASFYKDFRKAKIRWFDVQSGEGMVRLEEGPLKGNSVFVHGSAFGGDHNFGRDTDFEPTKDLDVLVKVLVDTTYIQVEKMKQA